MLAAWRKRREKKAAKEQPPCSHQRTLDDGSKLHTSKDNTALEEQHSEPAANGGDGSPKMAPPLVDEKGRCIPCRQEKRSIRRYSQKVIIGLILPFALQALDVTIIASALPWIAAEFGEVAQFNWIISAFNLTSAAFIPFWGQMTDIFGRHASIQASIVIMMIGSALCTGAPTSAFPVLLLGRGLQGLGCAGLNVVVRVILSDKVSLKTNARNWSIFSLTAGSSYGVGPVIGGYLVNANWRWCFAINLPICAAAVLLIIILLRKELLGPQPIPGVDEGSVSGRTARYTHRITTIDFGGQILFLLGFGLLVLAFTWAGATYDWNTAAVLVPLLVGVLLCVAFVIYERLLVPGGLLGRRWPSQRPMIAWKILATKDVGLLFYINFATGAAMYSVFYFCNLYFTLVKQYDAGKAGIQLLYYTPGLGVGVYMAMFFCNVWPRKTFVPLWIGSIIEAVGIGLMAYALYTEHTPLIFGMMALSGAGTGLRFMPGSLHAIGFFPNNIAAVVSLMGVAMPFGGTLGLTLMSTVFNNTSGIGKDSPLRDSGALSNVPDAVRDAIVYKAKMGIVWAFVAMVPFMILCVSAVSCLGNVDITRRSALDSDEGYGDVVYRGFYITKVFRKGGLSRRVGAEGHGDRDRDQEMIDGDGDGDVAKQ